jgi:hypothetical protein
LGEGFSAVAADDRRKLGIGCLFQLRHDASAGMAARP